jgi:hypothetical protein
MLKTRNVVLALLVLFGVYMAVHKIGPNQRQDSRQQYGRQSTKYDPMKHDKDKIGDGLNYRMVWSPTADKGGPARVHVDWGSSGYVTNWQPYWHTFPTNTGAVVRVTATAIIGRGQAAGWIEAWMFDQEGNQLDHCGPTDAKSGCHVVGTHP